MTRAESHALADAFEDSDLPYKVDIVDTRSTSAAFLAAIARDWAPLRDRPSGAKVRAGG